MAAKVLVLYTTPADVAAFDAYYAETHLPLVKQIPGLRSATLSTGPIGTPEGPAPYHSIAEFQWESMAELQAALATAEFGAAAADLGNFAGGGVSILIYDTRDA